MPVDQGRPGAIGGDGRGGDVLRQRSVGGKRWRWRLDDDRLGLMLAQRLGVPDLVGRVLAARDVSADAAPLFLAPSLRDLMPDPSHLRDMDRAVARLVAAVQAGETIAIFGDYDVDGATSTALLLRFFRAVGARPLFHIPDRITEGYGPNTGAMQRLQAAGAAVVITVDCGVTAHEPLAAARDLGLDVIVVDHHVAEPALPPAVAVIDANRLDETSPLGDLAAVGVAFLLAVAVNRGLRAAGWYASPDRHEPDLRQWLDLVALGTVCDMVPLTGLNRAFVTQGLKVMARRRNGGLATLADVARLDAAPTAYHAGYLLGPRVNAGGRVGEADLGTRLLAEDDPARALPLAERLDRFNDERKAIEQAVQTAAVEQIEARMAAAGTGAVADPILIAVGEDWHPGVIGIVAGRLRERFDRPAVVIGIDAATGIGKGSGRSMRGIDLGAAVLAARQAGLLIAGGGHPMAAGLTVAADRIDALTAFLTERIAARIGPDGIVPEIGLDGLLRPAAATVALIADLERVAPYGTANPEPRFALPLVRVVRAAVVGEHHVSCHLVDAAPGIGGRGAGGDRLKAIAFRSLDTPLGEALLAAGRPGGPVLAVAGHLRRDDWQGRTGVQLFIDDAAIVEP